MLIEAAILSGPGRGPLPRQIELAPPGPGEVLVEIEAAGLCPADWPALSGETATPLPHVPGHEGAGTVIDVGPGVEEPPVGAAVALASRAHGGEGESRSLATWATHTVVPAARCVPLPADLPPSMAALLGCGLTTGVDTALNQARVRPGSTVVIVGGGLVGLALVATARSAGAARIVVVDAGDHETARALGADDVVRAEDLVHDVMTLTGGTGADYAFDAAGRIGIETQLMGCVGRMGTAVVVGLPSADLQLRVDPRDLIWNDKTLTGSVFGRAHTPAGIAGAAALVEAGDLPIDRLDVGRYRLDQVAEAGNALIAGHHHAVVVTPRPA